MRKIYVLDTNILLYSPSSLNGFDDNIVAIPHMVLEELDQLKMSGGEKGFHAREAIRIIKDKLALDSSNLILCNCVEKEIANYLTGWDLKRPDNIILMSVLSLITERKEPVILITNDSMMQIKAHEMQIDVQNYDNTAVSAEER